MKLVRFGPRGHEKPGMVDDNGRIRDLSAHVNGIAADVLGDAGLAKLSALDMQSLPLVDEGVRFGPCVGRVGKFMAIGLNYSDHAKEAGMAEPAEPMLFTKYTSCLSGAYDDVVLPRTSTKADWEAELGFVIGRAAKYVNEADALDHIAGYFVVNDVSERAFQTGNTRTMIVPVAKLVSFLSGFFTLHPGDIITTGTPPGVGMGMKPPTYLKPGDEMRLGVSGLGEQQQTVVAEA